MHIRKLIFAAALCLGSLAFAPMAMADPGPDICVLSQAKASVVDYGLNTDLTCGALVIAEVSDAVSIPPTGEDAAPMSCSSGKLPLMAAFATYRPHEDPGRCSI